MKQTVPLLVYIISMVLLIAIFVLILTQKTNVRDAKILQLQDSVTYFGVMFKQSQARADSSESLTDFYAHQAMSAVTETITIQNNHVQIRDSISSLHANGSIHLLARNLKANQAAR